MTKHIICLGDGMADHNIAHLNGKTPLEVAKTPNIDFISQNGNLGMVDTVPAGFSPGSDVANMGILGYDPNLYYTGRGPIEAASMNIKCSPSDVIFRCNIVCIENSTMKDFTAGHISTAESTLLINQLNTAFKNSPITFYSGVSYRHIMVVEEKYANLITHAPHDITDKNITSYLPSGKHETEFLEIIKKANTILNQSQININRQKNKKKLASSIWPWSQGKSPTMPSFKSLYSKTGGIITGVDLLKGLGKLASLETPDILGATGFIDTNYEEKVKGALTILNNHDFCYLHIEAPDEAGHMGDVNLKIQAIEDFDKKVVGPILNYQKENPDCVIMVLPDHPTPCDIKTHTHEPVPYCFYHRSMKSKSLKSYSEKNAKTTKIHFNTPWDLLTTFLNTKP
jgi:2,3-bisphosphoglycerate-independent phosphoglycerate mutase